MSFGGYCGINIAFYGFCFNFVDRINQKQADMKSLSDYINARNKQPQYFSLSMIVTYTFADDDDRDLTNEFKAFLMDLDFIPDVDQSTFSMPFAPDCDLKKVAIMIEEWVGKNSSDINPGSHVGVYYPVADPEKGGVCHISSTLMKF